MLMVCRKLRVVDIVNGEWDDENQCVRTVFGKINEIRAFGTVMDKFVTEDGKYSYIILDDGTETMRLKTWRDDVRRMDGIEKGDIVDIIGKLNYYNEEIYIFPKIIKKISYNFWLLRHLEIIENLKTLPREKIETKVTKEKKKEEIEEFEILDSDVTTKKILETLESGEFSKEEIIEKTSLDEIDVELALRELTDEKKIEEKNGKFKAV
jgi:RPA family protein